MAKQQQMHMPGVFGGLMRYDSEYKSNFIFSPAAVIAFVVAVIAFVLILKIFFPIGAGLFFALGIKKKVKKWSATEI